MIDGQLKPALQKTPDKGLPILLQLIAQEPEIAATVSDDVDARLRAYIEKAPVTELNLFMPAALGIPAFKALAEARANELDSDAVARYLSERPDAIYPVIIERALGFYAKSGNFAVANRLAETSDLLICLRELEEVEEER